MAVNIGAGGVRREMSDGAVGVGGAKRGISEGYAGVGGTKRKFYASLPPVGRTLDSCTWEEIARIARAGKGAEYFKVRDVKKIHISGSIGSYKIDFDTYPHIIDFGHDGGNTIEFDLFGNSNGEGLCLTDSNSGTLQMNKSADCFGGWKRCNMRYAMLGSTDMASADASATTAKNPVAGSLMSCLPPDLRAVMQPMTIWTDNRGLYLGGESAVTATVDYLPLPAPREIGISMSGGNSYENSHQKTYAYYKDGGCSKGDVTSGRTGYGYDYDYWLRSPAVGVNEQRFLYFRCTTWTAETNNANVSMPIAPMFRVG